MNGMNEMDGMNNNVTGNGTENKKKINWLAWSLAITALVASFLFGVLTHFIYQAATDSDLMKKYRALDQIIDKASKEYYEDISQADLLEAAIKGITSELDAYSTIYNEEEYEIIYNQSQGQNDNFGYSVRSLPRRPVSVHRVVGGSPAATAGLKAGDEIIGLKYETDSDYRDLSYMTYNEVYALLGKSKYSLKVQRLKPEVFFEKINNNTDVNAVHDVLNDRNNFDIIELPLMQSKEYDVTYVYYYIDSNRTNITDENMISDFQNGFSGSGAAYIKLTEFTGTQSGGASKQFADAMELFKSAGKSRLILDLRDNPGGNTNVLGVVGSYLLFDKNKPSQGNIPIFIAKDKNDNRTTYTTMGRTATESGSRYKEFFGEFEEHDKKITVLLNGNSASASEALACAIQDYGTGTLVGTTTYKKGIMQRTYDLTGFPYYIPYYLKVTTATYYSPVNTNFTLHGIGLLTDTTSENYVKDNFYGYENCRRLVGDGQFMRALAVLGISV